ncbi:unnamed protein product [Notodromas monacha]|uniref:Thioredoxin domain-containing protein n=1 Tax=Notodromas monacha TaxID=399045 RepID=A0A7R9BMX8_9CRUS|nr:unnamed protein product [Notodromas monacha]CAG0918138.1 unnamed protein product [Notodromas monacha]
MASVFKGRSLRRKTSRGILTHDPESVLNGVPMTALYFSAAWCGPCKRFTPLLKELYEKQDAGIGKMMEVVFVSLDKSESAMMEYYMNDHGRWLYVPYEYGDFIISLQDKYRIAGIPCLTVIGKQGNTISIEAGRKLSNIGIDGFRNWLFSKVPLVVELDTLIEEWKRDWLKDNSGYLGNDSVWQKKLYKCICPNGTEEDNEKNKQEVPNQELSIRNPEPKVESQSSPERGGLMPSTAGPLSGSLPAPQTENRAADSSLLRRNREINVPVILVNNNNNNKSRQHHHQQLKPELLLPDPEDPVLAFEAARMSTGSPVDPEEDFPEEEEVADAARRSTRF